MVAWLGGRLSSHGSEFKDIVVKYVADSKRDMPVSLKRLLSLILFTTALSLIAHLVYLPSKTGEQLTVTLLF